MAYEPYGDPNRRAFMGLFGAGKVFSPKEPRYTPKEPSPAGDEDKKEVDYWSLEKIKRCYKNYLDNKTEEVEEQQDSRRYRHGAQWSKYQVEKFNERRQPVVTYNRIGRKIDAIVGLMEKIKQDPKAYPRTPDPKADIGAELSTSVLRYVNDKDLRSTQIPYITECGATDGIGGVEMLLEKGDRGDTEIGFAKVKPDEFWYDPRSFEHDFSDARYLGIAKWLDLEDAKALAPDKATEIEDTASEGTEFTTHSDREQKWFDYAPDHKRIRVIDIWYKHDGGWCWCVFTGAMKLKEGKGYFFNERGDMICKYIMFSAFVDHDGDRYGFVRNLKSSQDEINQRRSKGLHELASRRIRAEDGAFTDIEVARRESVRPDGVVIYNKGFEMEFDDAARIANVEGQLKFLEDAKNEIENFGPNPALIGQGLEYKSGRAINLLQQAGIAELGPFVVSLKNWKLRLYRAIWCAVQRYWTAERWIRVTDDEGIAQFIRLNGVGVDEAGIPRLVNSIGQLDVDIILDEGPDEINVMADAYDTLVVLAQQGAKISPMVLLELAPLPSSQKRKIMDMQAQEDPETKAAKQIALQGESAKVAETQSKTQLNQAKAQQEAQGGAHGIVERQMDMKAKEQEAQLKAAGKAEEIRADREKNQVTLMGEMAKMRLQQAQAVNKAHVDNMTMQMKAQNQRAEGEMKLRQAFMAGNQKLEQGRQQHQMRMQSMMAKPTGVPRPVERTKASAPTASRPGGA